MSNYLSNYTGAQIDAIIALLHGKGLDSVDGVVQRNGTTGAFSSASIPQGTVTGVTAGAGLNTTSADTSTDGGTINVSGTLYLTLSGATAGSYGESSDKSPGYAGTFRIPYVTVDKYGRVTGIANKTITIPSEAHYQAKNITTNANDSTTQTTSALTNGNVYLNLIENSTVRSSQKISGSGTTQVTTDASGNIIISSADSKTGTVTSVRVQAAGPLQSSTSTEQTTSLNTTISFTNQDPNKVLAGPASGSSGAAPTFRALVAADIPSITKSKISDFPASMPASDVYAWAKAANKPSYSASEVGAVATSAVGAASGVAPLNASGLIDSTYLPSYVDDVIEGYYYDGKFYKEAAHTTVITGETGKIYVDLPTNKTYRYGGSSYTQIAEGTIVSVSRTLTSGTKSATITVNGTDYDIYSTDNTTYSAGTGLSLSNGAFSVKLGYTTSGNNRKVQADGNGNLYVEQKDTNTTYSLTQDSSDGHKITLTPSSGTAQTITIPDNNTTYSAGTGLGLSGTTFSVKLGYTTSGNNRAVQADANGNLYVVQKDDNTTYSAGTGLSLSSNQFSVKLGYTTSGNNRAVQADSSGNLYVVQKDDNTWTALVGATSSANGSVGYINAVPPKDGYNTKFFRADGTWAVPAGTTYSAGTGLTLSGSTFNHSNSVTAQNTQAIYPIKIDAQGHISAYGTAVTPLTADSSLNAAKLTGTVPSSCYTNTTYSVAVNGTAGLVKPWYNHTSAATGPTAGSDATAVAVNTISTTAGRYYAIEMDSNGRMFVNVPWSAGSSTDTKNTAGTTNKTGSKMYLVGATEQSANPVTYSNANVYIGTDNCLYSNGAKVLTSHQDISGKIDTAGTGLSKSGTTLNHSNSVTAQTTQAVYPIKIDAQGHISAYGSAVTIPTLKSPTIATSSGTNQLTLAANTKYVLTTSGGSFVFTTPPDNNTTYSAGTGLSLSNTTFSVKTGYTTSGNNRKVQADSNGNLYVVQTDTWTANSSSAAGYVPSGGTSSVSTGITKVYATNSSNVPAWHDPWVMYLSGSGDTLYDAVVACGWSDCLS